MEQKPCRSVSPVLIEGMVGLPCVKPRGHKSSMHHNPSSTRRWEGGINVPARWEYVDDGYMSEADYQSWGRFV